MSILSNANAMSSEAYVIGNSLRFQAASSQYLSRTPSVAGNRQTWTWSGWVKRGALSSFQSIFGAQSSTLSDVIAFNASDQITVYSDSFLAGPGFARTSTAVYRDPSAWYHVVVTLDTTNATAQNRCRIWINGTEITAWSANNTITQNAQGFINNNVQHIFGRNPASAGQWLDGYMAEVNFIDGQALTPSSFGYNNPYTGVWVAEKYTGSYGTNGFYLPFSNGTSTATLGVDYSGNNNNWNLNNFSLSTTNVPLQFTTVGTTQWKVPTGVTSISYVVVGGGAGGASYGGGGGGAGGFVEGTLSVTPGNTVAITVGAGGAASTNGGNSSLGGVVIAYGGGTGGSDGAAGTNGGSGGGGGTQNGTTNWGTSIQTSPAGGTGYGNRGGAKSGGGSYAGGGGGGAGAVGADSTGLGVGGAGGAGRASSITGASVTYAGGGGGFGYYTGGAGGSGGGGAGSTISGTGANATGYGCGGGSGGTGGGSGSQGIVIIQYAVPSTTWPWMKDVPSGNGYRGLSASSNYATWSPIDKSPNSTVSQGNLYAINTNATYQSVRSTIGVTAGKWYWEIYGGQTVGICTNANNLSSTNEYLANTSSAWGYVENGNKSNAGSNVAYGATFTSSDIIGIAFDADIGSLTFYKNNVSQGVAYSSGLTGSTYFAWCSMYNSSTARVNFGQRPFAYTPPTGFLPLCVANLPVPTILQGNKFMDATTYTGNGTTGKVVTNAAGFAPDFVWIKDRSAANYHGLFDVIRGAGYALYSNGTFQESAFNAQTLQSFNSNGFTVGTNGDFNTNTNSYVGWQWDAGSSTVTNTNGSISSQVRANPTAGVSVVTFTSTGSAGAVTVGHGLGVAPAMVITKERGAVGSWGVYHKGLATPASQYLNLQTTSAATTNTSYWGNTNPSSTVVTLGNGTMMALNTTMVMYCFAEIAGFSKFGSYTGNGSTDGPFVYTGFRPKFIMWKRSDSTSDWRIWDTSRSPYNAANLILFPNDPGAEYTDANQNIDILSNGFKLRSTTLNVNGGTYIYMAFAENPFNFSNAR